MKQLFFLSTLFGIVCFHYVAMRLLARRGGWWPWAAFLSPIAFLLAIRHVALIQTTLETLLPSGIVTGPLLAFYTGISYLSFRLSRLVVEVRNETVPQPGLAQYLGYAFFVPTFVVGPISSYNAHYSSIARPSRDITPIDRSLLRLVVGLTKYQFLGNLFNQLAYQQFLLDGHAHAPLDLLVSAVAYHLYLYCNFSGFCDMAIGAAGLLQVRVQENFRNPFAARNLQEYWSRWHITLSSWMRELVFAPLSKYLVGKWGSRNLPHAAGVSIAVVFLLVGIWHGVGWQYAAFGAAHAAALTAHHYYNLWLKRILSKEAYRAYQSNRWVNAAGIAITFACTTSFLFLFANDFAAAQKILAAIRF